MSTRREFLAGSALAGLGVGLGSFSTIGCGGGQGNAEGEPNAEAGGISPAENPLRILILGGTAFLGPAQVDYALARGHEVTLFNRGRTNPHLFPDVEKLIGDRAEPDYSALEGHEWDAVIDNSANVASWLDDATQVLQDRAGRYLFVSSISAHSDNSTVGQTEDGPVFSEEDYNDAVASGAGLGAAFGPNKAQAERLTFRAFGDRGIVVRPGLIVGPMDNSGRFTYWPVRIDRGGEVLAPGDGNDLTQIVDVRDLSKFMVHLVEQEQSGTFNATGPESPMTMAEMLAGIRSVTSTPVTITWVHADFLREHEVGGWMEMPCWVYPSPETAGFSAYDCTKAINAGLAFRPLAETARDTLAWWKSLPEEQQALRTGIDPEKEANILRVWSERSA
ncbi:MAG: NAD-dependent epimerase/dehydratase family protein [Gemmatimonadetes bacterium]|nr:NAD-dependent epimerase/dehydratase family protein [Gemmatimonadota bacterium]NNM07114.1 NAD-dependent epimerase/dehydratase family protein [Gemmatimonadota bacterium]